MVACPKPAFIKSHKRKKKTERQLLVLRLDALVREIVLLRDKKCVICGTTNALQAGHLFTRAKMSVRWNLKNVFVQCRGHNYLHEWDPQPFTKFFLDKFGIDEYNALYQKAEVPEKISIGVLEELGEILEEELKIVQRQQDTRDYDNRGSD